jgi:hypothetical protein
MKKIHTFLCLIFAFSVMNQTSFAQTVINPLVSNENPKLQFGLSEIVDLANNKQIINPLNVSNFQLLNLKENNTKIRVDILTTGNGSALYQQIADLGIEIVARHQNFFTAWVEITKVKSYLDKAPSNLKGILPNGQTLPVLWV